MTDIPKVLAFALSAPRWQYYGVMLLLISLCAYFISNVVVFIAVSLYVVYVMICWTNIKYAWDIAVVVNGKSHFNAYRAITKHVTPYDLYLNDIKIHGFKLPTFTNLCMYADYQVDPDRSVRDQYNEAIRVWEQNVMPLNNSDE